MLRFNGIMYACFRSCTTFQYILCYGSTETAVIKELVEYDFNTSYVTVQLCSFGPNWGLCRISIHLMLRFNAICSSIYKTTKRISIHLMLRFNPSKICTKINTRKFQYILCYGSTASRMARFMPYIKFQYILCYGSTYL